MNNIGSSTTTIAGLTNGVLANLQGRTDLTETNPNPSMRPSFFIKRTIEEITGKFQFEELRIVGPTVPLTVGQYSYPVATFINSGDDVTFYEDPVIFIDFPANQVAYPMDYMTPKAIAPLLNVRGGIPFKYTRYGANFWFGTNPGQPYPVYLPYQRKHPFNDQSLPDSQVFLPQDWKDVVEFDAARRAAISLRWNDQASYLQKLLYGDPMKPGDIGILTAKMLDIERSQGKSSRSLTPIVGRY